MTFLPANKLPNLQIASIQEASDYCSWKGEHGQEKGRMVYVLNIYN